MLLPRTRTETEFVEVVRLTAPGHLTPKGLSGDTVDIWVEHEARRALELIAALPPGEQHRCFVPGWGIRAHGPTDPLFEIAFCFRCHGARLWGPDLPPALRGQPFDADSPAAHELLRRFRARLPPEPAAAPPG
ncbi:hypothetical protein ACIRQY_18555 [Streptomyces sp. NPDC101490]|uniref:hypothetical protein n=1 Tax=Streptomyces sp. NPDC101490 TaxID=3366143 RepID=UPI00382C47A1